MNENKQVNYYTQNDIVKLSLRRKYENCDIDADLAGMIIPYKNTDKTQMQDTNQLNNITYSMFNAELITRNNHHTLKAAPKTIPLRRRDRLNQSSLKKYTYGKLNLAKLLSMMRQAGLNQFKLFERDEENCCQVVTDENSLTSKRYSVEFDKLNRIELDISANLIDVKCENDEHRVKIKDCLLKCLSSL